MASSDTTNNKNLKNNLKGVILMIEQKISTRFGIATLNKSSYYEVEQNAKKIP